ncbi:MAG TPA: GGDEF domain-containing protein [Rhizobiaceae bacterium]|nr:GGDEF domain-containing protein [Rhizobiaceae bacterium]
MSGADYILTINMIVAGLLATAFLMIAVYDRARVSARWLALAYFFGVAYLIVEAAMPFVTNARWPVVFAFALFLAATFAFNVGVARKYEVAFPWRLSAVIFAVSVVAVALVQDLPRHSIVRMMAYQAPYFVMQAIGAGLVMSSRQRRALDSAFAVLLAASAVQFLAKPFLAGYLGGWGANPQAYLESDYAMASQTTGTILAMAIALMMLVILVRDLVSHMMETSETDALSGLLNRRGFERQASRASIQAVEQGMPVSLIIADIDHFKSINDDFGHATGDRVISAFSQFLRSALSSHHVAGRIGGEEFAIVLPGTNLVAARLFAEGVRGTAGGLYVEGLPQTLRFTASFGVAELAKGESLSDLLQRADQALYDAKKSGRDRVRVASNSAVGGLSRFTGARE